MFVAYAWFSSLIISSTMMYMAYQRGFSVMCTFKLEIAELIITSFLVISLGWLLAFQVYMLRQNKTSIEYHKLKDGNPFNRFKDDEEGAEKKNDAQKNIQDVFGKNMSFWSLLLPFADHGEK